MCFLVPISYTINVVYEIEDKKKCGIWEISTLFCGIWDICRFFNIPPYLRRRLLPATPPPPSTPTLLYPPLQLILPTLPKYDYKRQYSNTVYFLGLYMVTNTIQYGLTAVLPPRIKVRLLTLLSLPCCHSLPSSRTWTLSPHNCPPPYTTFLIFCNDLRLSIISILCHLLWGSDSFSKQHCYPIHSTK